jgi:TetR/AcrR family transcriptional regulator, transcriptional repressor for nem operon
MRKGKLTRELILEKAAGLFNSRGYFGASISDVMEATGLEKGGIYNHFGSKDELALAAFDHVVAINAAKVLSAVGKCESSVDKLLAIIDCFEDVVLNPSIPGGCPLLNCAVESDDAHPALKERVQKAMLRLLGLVESIVATGIKSGELHEQLTPYTVANHLIASVEGAIMLSKLYGEPGRFSSVASSLKQFIQSCAVTPVSQVDNEPNLKTTKKGKEKP